MMHENVTAKLRKYPSRVQEKPLYASKLHRNINLSLDRIRRTRFAGVKACTESSCTDFFLEWICTVLFLNLQYLPVLASGNFNYEEEVNQLSNMPHSLICLFPQLLWLGSPFSTRHLLSPIAQYISDRFHLTALNPYAKFRHVSLHD